MKSAMQELLDWLHSMPKVPMSRDLLVSKILIGMESEKRQIMNAVSYGLEVEAGNIERDYSISAGEQYYNETFKPS